MITTYGLLKFLHILSVIVWVGGNATLSIVGARFARNGDPNALQVYAAQSRFYGTVVVGSAAFVTLVAGIAMVAVSGMGFEMLWLQWGFWAILISLALGGTLIRSTANKIQRALTSDVSLKPRLPALQWRLTTLNAVNLLLLFSAVAAMVLKPV
ncbi:MAG: DUF2269 family protein [Caldilineaceae bacterium]